MSVLCMYDHVCVCVCRGELQGEENDMEKKHPSIPYICTELRCEYKTCNKKFAILHKRGNELLYLCTL